MDQVLIRLLVACLLLMAAPAWAGITTIVALPSTPRAAGTYTLGPIALPVGMTAVTASVDRTTLSVFPETFSWGLELSLDGGASWLPWGAATSTGAATIDPKTGLPPTRSTITVSLVRRLRDGSIEPGFEPTNPLRQIRGTANLPRTMTTSIGLDLDDAPVPAKIAVAAAHHSVAFDNKNDVAGASVTSLTTSAFTITGSANRAAILGLIANSNSLGSPITGSCGGVSGNAITGTDTTTTATGRTLMFGVKNPASGSQTATLTWNGIISGASLGVMTASGVDQTTTFNNGTFTNGTSATPSVTVTSNSGDLTMDTTWPSGADASPTQTQLWLDAVQTGGGGSRGAGAGNTTHAWTQSPSGDWVSSGANMIQAAGGGPAAPPERTKLGVGT